jgi:hypothetical protein
MNTLEQIQKWFLNQCDRDWEQEYGIKIETLGNPGWDITIDVSETPLERVSIENPTIENSDDDWYFFKVKDGKFIAAGDPGKLEFLLKKFLELTSQYSAKHT